MRITAIFQNNTKSTDKSDHGLIVTTILAGNNGKGSKKSEVYGASISNGPAYQVDIEYYRTLPFFLEMLSYYEKHLSI